MTLAGKAFLEAIRTKRCLLARSRSRRSPRITERKRTPPPGPGHFIYMRRNLCRTAVAVVRRHSSSLVPQSWQGVRGNFAPGNAADPFLGFPKCKETLFTSPPGLINLDTGAPCASLLAKAKDTMAEGMAHWQEMDASSTMQYGPVEGTYAYRERLAGFLERAYGDADGDIPCNTLLQTSGATHGLQLVISTIFGRVPLARRVAFIEE
jgi:DNA-binding transcriptional MocR family regulator